MRSARSNQRDVCNNINIRFQTRPRQVVYSAHLRCFCQCALQICALYKFMFHSGTLKVVYAKFLSPSSFTLPFLSLPFHSPLSLSFPSLPSLRSRPPLIQLRGLGVRSKHRYSIHKFKSVLYTVAPPMMFHLLTY